jgi:hypothetical protein
MPMNSDLGSANRACAVSAAWRCSARSLARVLDAEEGRDRQHLAQGAVLARRDQHARQLRVHRQARHGAADRREAALRVDRAQFLQYLPAIGDGACVGGFEKGKLLDPSETQRQHPQDHVGKTGAQDFRIGVARPRLVVGLGV